MSLFKSFLAPQIDTFVSYRKISNKWSAYYESALLRFEKHCIINSPNSKSLTQEMVDSWYKRNGAHRSQVYAIYNLVNFLRARGLTDVYPPTPPKAVASTYIPHAFSDEELANFFNECDNFPITRNSLANRSRKIIIPAFFRLLYSSGIRTTEARLLRVENVDTRHGFLDIQYSKGGCQHFVALHDSMTELLIRYEEAISHLYPNREYFFPSSRGAHLSKNWVVDNFQKLWRKSNPNSAHAVAYAFRHHYAVTNINKWVEDGFAFDDKLLSLSKSMGHYDIESTKYYYSLVPAFADILEAQTKDDFDEIVPEVDYEKV
jgi:integrase